MFPSVWRFVGLSRSSSKKRIARRDISKVFRQVPLALEALEERSLLSASALATISSPIVQTSTAGQTATILDTTAVQGSGTDPNPNPAYYSQLIQAVQGTSFTGVAATFTDSGVSTLPANADAWIDWGNGQTTDPATITPDPKGGFDVTGTNTWAVGGFYTVRVTIDLDPSVNDPFPPTVTSHAIITCPELAVQAIPVTVPPGGGNLLTAAVASFTDAGPVESPSFYGASVTVVALGNTPVASVPQQATVVANPQGGFLVQAKLEPEAETFIVALGSVTGQTGTAVMDTATIGDTPITATGTTVTGTVGNPFNGTVATFQQVYPYNVTSYSATINWGDGTAPSTGVISTVAGGGFTVSGSHSYANAGSYPVSVTIQDGNGGSVVAQGAAAVALAPIDSQLYVNRTFFRATAGQALGVRAATFMSTNPNAQAADFTATINWGDGQTSTGTITSNPAGAFVVTGTHTYYETGTLAPVVTITESGGRTVAVTDEAIVAPSPVPLQPPLNAPFYVSRTFFRASVGQTLTTPVATFTSTSSAAVAADFSATIDWGDGQTSVGTITANASGGFTVNGTHTYAAAGSFFPVVTITEQGGRTVAATDITIVGPVQAVTSGTTPPRTAAVDDTEAILGPSPWA